MRAAVGFVPRGWPEGSGEAMQEKTVGASSRGRENSPPLALRSNSPRLNQSGAFRNFRGFFEARGNFRRNACARIVTPCAQFALHSNH